MLKTPTPHISANKDEVAKTVLMPGDPLRAKLIAEKYLSDVKCFNAVRNMLGYTGTFNGIRVSVMGSGMGIPSMGIYSYELFNAYEVENIIRVGTAGCIKKELNLKDIIIAMGACTNSNYASTFNLPGYYSPIADFDLLRTVYDTCIKQNIKSIVGNVLSSDTFYTDNKENDLIWNKMNVLAVEMETAALYMNAARAGKKALSILTISDNILTGEGLSSEERVMGFNNMIKLALDSIKEL